MRDFIYELGDEVKDRVSNFQGIVITQTRHLNGCHQYGVAPKVDKDGKMADSYNIDEAQLELVSKGLNKTKPVKQADVGGATTKIARNTL